MTDKNYDFSIQNDFPDHMVDSNLLTQEIGGAEITSAVLKCINTSGDVCSIVFDGELSEDDQTTLDGVVAAHAPALALAKKAKFAELAERTAQLVQVGYEYPPESGTIYGMEFETQFNLFALWVIRDLPQMTYPVNWQTKDKYGLLSITDADMLNGFFLTALGFKRAVKDSETPLDDEVRAAITVEQVNAIVDPR